MFTITKTIIHIKSQHKCTLNISNKKRATDDDDDDRDFKRM